MPERKQRADATRNREAVLAAADALFARSDSPRSVSMDEVAAAAGVGKGTLFRRFGDRTGLIQALYEARVQPLREAVESGPAPLGPTTPPLERVPALLDAMLSFKMDNRHLSMALEEAGSGSPYAAGTTRGGTARWRRCCSRFRPPPPPPASRHTPCWPRPAPTWWNTCWANDR